MGEYDNLIKEFLVESYENLDQLDQQFVTLEQNPGDRETLSGIFRTIHTIKGTCGFLGYSKLESLTHVGESLLSLLRDGEIPLTAEITTSLLAMVDAVREILGSIETTGTEGDGDYSELIQTLTTLQSAGGGSSVPQDLVTWEAELRAEIAQLQGGSEAIAEESVHKPEVPAISSVPPAEEATVYAPGTTNTAESSKPSSQPKEVAEFQPHPNDGKGPSLTENNIRVDVSLLDKLMNLVGELVLARNQVLQFGAHLDDSSFGGTSQRLNLITTELQEGVMKTRMQPIGNIWNKFPRVVRDLAMQCGKQIRLEMEGKDTELDKTLIEAIKDPLTHIIRNSVDHGIETPEVRKTRGKPAEGTLFLRAYHEGGQVNIEISDDGGGIDTEKVKEKAIQKGLVTREQLGQMSERDLVNLVCLPGFSTAERITNVSGRGVGMDVVRTNIEKIGGAVDIQSRAGQGTTIKIKIPLTLAIIPALVVTNNGERFAIPQVSLLELVRLEGEQSRKGIEMIHGAPVYRLRGNLLPLVILTNELTGPEGTKRDLTSYSEDDAINIVVLQADGRQFGLIVDEINDTEEIVVKPLGKQLKGISAFAGATIMGDGRVALILDVLGLAQKSGVVSELRDGTISDKVVHKQDAATSRHSLLLFGVGESRRMALPLSEVTRLEEFPRSAVETAGNQFVVQYRGHIMPLIRVSQYVGVDDSPTSMGNEALPVVVHTNKGQTIGLVVNSIIDIVDEAITIERCAAGSGILGSAVIQGRVTDVVDVEGIIEAANPMTEELALAA